MNNCVLQRCVIVLGILAAAAIFVAARARGADLAYVELYDGWAGPNGGKLHGRVHRAKPSELPKLGESTWGRLMANVSALETNGLPNAEVTATGLPSLVPTTASKTGFFTIELPAGLKPEFVTVSVSASTRERKAAPVSLQVRVWDGSPGIAVISDIDDTVADTGVTHKFTMIKNTLLNSPFTMKTFPGTAALLTAAAGKDGPNAVRPLFFLSGSPWPLHERTREFFDLQQYPRGSITLRRYSAESLDPYKFKYPHLLEFIDALPSKEFVLLGDDGEKDPEVYAAVRNERPGRVKAIYIHDVTGEKATSSRFTGMKVFKDWNAGAQDLVSSGLGAR